MMIFPTGKTFILIQMTGAEIKTAENDLGIAAMVLPRTNASLDVGEFRVSCKAPVSNSVAVNIA